MCFRSQGSPGVALGWMRRFPRLGSEKRRSERQASELSSAAVEIWSLGQRQPQPGMMGGMAQPSSRLNRDHTGGSGESSPAARPVVLFVRYALPSASLHDEYGCRQPGQRWMGVHIVRELLGPRYVDGVRWSQLQHASRGWVRIKIKHPLI